jgi:hypothetical protein
VPSIWRLAYTLTRLQTPLCMTPPRGSLGLGRMRRTMSPGIRDLVREINDLVSQISLLLVCAFQLLRHLRNSWDIIYKKPTALTYGAHAVLWIRNDYFRIRILFWVLMNLL